MKRRGFFKAIMGVLLFPYFPAPKVYRPDQVIMTINGEKMTGYGLGGHQTVLQYIADPLNKFDVDMIEYIPDKGTHGI